jgi:Skp family chaperone for outer membrane proteins
MANAIEAITGKLDLRPKNTGGGSLRPPKGSRGFAILRVGKISGMGKVAAAAQHNLRERETLNARPEDASRNIHLAGAKTADEVLELWKDRAPDKIRKNAVHALEYIVTASPEKMAAMGQTKGEEYLRDAFAWIEEKHGAENILSAVIHIDETTPHLQVMLIPIDERGKLNARGLVGGKAQLSAMQTDFAERVGRNHGLQRGIERSGARHEDIKSFRARAIAVENLSITLPERATGSLGVFGGETAAEYHQRLSRVHTEALKTVAAGYDGLLNAKDNEIENLTYKLKDAENLQTDTELKLESERQRRHLVESAYILQNQDEDVREQHIAEFQERYLSACAHLDRTTISIIDQMLEDVGSTGYWHVEQERLAAHEEREAEMQASRDQARSYHPDNERDDGYSR